MRWTLVLVAACGTAGAPPPPLVGSAAVDPTLAAPPSSTCTWGGPWEYGQPETLALRDGGPIFGTIGRVERATLEVGPNGAFVELASKELTVRGFVDRRAVRLHPARALAIASHLLPGPRAVLRPAETAGSKLTVEAAPPRHVVAEAPPRAQLACRDLTLEVATFDPLSVLGDVRTTDAALAGATMSLQAHPQGPRVAELRLDEEVPVSVLEQRGGLARVVLDPHADVEADLYVVGWVPSQHLRPAWGGRSLSGGYGGGRGLPRGRPPKRSVRCAHEVAFWVVLGDERRIVGAIAPAAEIGIVGETADGFEIAIGRLGLSLVDGARAEVERAAVASCQSR